MPKELDVCVRDHVQNRAHQSMSTEDLYRGVRSVLVPLQRQGFGVLGKVHEGTCLVNEPTSSAHVGVTMMPAN